MKLNFELIVGTEYSKIVWMGITHYIPVKRLPSFANEFVFTDNCSVALRLIQFSEYATKENEAIKCRAEINDVFEAFIRSNLEVKPNERNRNTFLCI